MPLNHFFNRAECELRLERSTGDSWTSARATDSRARRLAAMYTEVNRAGALRTQPGTLQLGEGVQIRPTYFDDFLLLNYRFAYQQFFAPGNSNFTFQRVTADLISRVRDLLNHEHERTRERDGKNIFYRATDKSQNGWPDEFAFFSRLPIRAGPGCCGDYALTVRKHRLACEFFLAESMTPGGNLVPFYFQPTLGGMNINGTASLPSYQDFRFRAPNVMFFRQSLEHSIWGGRLGFL